MNRWWKFVLSAGAVACLLAAAFVLAVPDGSDVDASSPPGAVVVGTMNVDGISGTIELRGIDFAVLGAGTGAGGGGAQSPAAFDDLVVVKDVDATSPMLLKLVVTAQLSRTVTIDLYGPDGAVVTRITVASTTLRQLAIAHDGETDQRLLETVAWDLSQSQVRIEVRGTSYCWDNYRDRTC